MNSNAKIVLKNKPFILTKFLNLTSTLMLLKYKEHGEIIKLIKQFTEHTYVRKK
jgi:hypothetical protein